MLETNQTIPDFLSAHVPEADEPVKFEDDTDDEEEDGNGETGGGGWGAEDGIAANNTAESAPVEEGDTW